MSRLSSFMKKFLHLLTHCLCFFGIVMSIEYLVVSTKNQVLNTHASILIILFSIIIIMEKNVKPLAAGLAVGIYFGVGLFLIGLIAWLT